MDQFKAMTVLQDEKEARVEQVDNVIVWILNIIWDDIRRLELLVFKQIELFDMLVTRAEWDNVTDFDSEHNIANRR